MAFADAGVAVAAKSMFELTLAGRSDDPLMYEAGPPLPRLEPVVAPLAAGVLASRKAFRDGHGNGEFPAAAAASFATK